AEALASRLIPHDCATAPIQGVNPSAMVRYVLCRIDIAIKSMTKSGPWITANSGREEDLVAPDDRTRMRQTRDGRFPLDVERLSFVPAYRKVLAVSHARGIRTAE